MKSMLFVIFALTLAGTASADSVWTYAGNTMTGCNCSLDGSVTLNATGQAIDWDFTDGTHELTQANSSGQVLSTDLFHLGTFFTWFVSLTDNNGISFLSEFDGSAFEATDASSVNGSLFGFLQGNRGLWTPAVATAEPATGLLLTFGLAFGALMRRRSVKS
jgi:hypothetical protein